MGKRQQGYLRGTVQAHGENHRAQASVGIEDEVAHPIESPYIVLCPFRQVKRTEPWKPDLTPMGVTRELQVNGKPGDHVGIIRLMHKQDSGLVAREPVQSFLQV